MTPTLPTLSRVALAVDDPSGCARVLADAFSEALPAAVLALHRPEEPAHPGAPSGRALSSLEMAVPDLDALAGRLEAAGVGGAWAPSGKRRLHLDPSAWSGVPVTLVDAEARSTPNIAGGIDHIGVATPDVRLAEARFAGLLGTTVESRQTDTETTVRVEQFASDTYGVSAVTREETRVVTGLRVLFLSLANADLELLQDLAPAEADGTAGSSTAGDRTAIGRYLERSGPGLHHLALRVDDLDAALARAEGAGAALLDRRGRPGSRLARIAFLDPRSTGRILFHFVERRGAT